MTPPADIVDLPHLSDAEKIEAAKRAVDLVASTLRQHLSMVDAIGDILHGEG